MGVSTLSKEQIKVCIAPRPTRLQIRSMPAFMRQYMRGSGVWPPEATVTCASLCLLQVNSLAYPPARCLMWPDGLTSKSLLSFERNDDLTSLLVREYWLNEPTSQLQRHKSQLAWTSNDLGRKVSQSSKSWCLWETIRTNKLQSVLKSTRLQKAFRRFWFEDALNKARVIWRAKCELLFTAYKR